MKTSAKNKIYLVSALWLGLVALMFLYLFKILDGSNAALVERLRTQQHTALVLEAEQDSYRQAQSDLEKVKTQKYQPEDLFTNDVSLVGQLRVIEGLSETYGVKATLSGLSGTIKTASKAKTQSELYQVPYTLTVLGNFNDVLQFLEALEHLKFINTITTIAVGAGTGDQVNVNLSAQFYLRK